MKKSNAQAERPSNRAGALRGSRPRTEVFEQNDTANQMELHALHLRSSIFFYFYLDYKHKHTASAVGCHVPHLPPPPPFKHRLQAQASYALYVWNFFYFLDYKHKRGPRPGVKHQAAEALPTAIFYWQLRKSYI